MMLSRTCVRRRRRGHAPGRLTRELCLSWRRTTWPRILRPAPYIVRTLLPRKIMWLSLHRPLNRPSQERICERKIRTVNDTFAVRYLWNKTVELNVQICSTYTYIDSIHSGSFNRFLPYQYANLFYLSADYPKQDN